jgi:hypothetical protein
MKKSIIFFLFVTIFFCGLAQAEKYTSSESFYSPAIKHSDKLKSRLVKKLENEPEYVNKYYKVALNLLHAEKATQITMQDLNNKIKIVEQKMFKVISKAGRLTDDTPFFLSKNGEHNYYAINGKPIPLSAISKVTPKKDISSWEEYVSLYKQRQKNLDDKAEIIKYRDETLKKSRKKIIDPDILKISGKLKKSWLDYKKNNL